MKKTILKKIKTKPLGEKKIKTRLWATNINKTPCGKE